MPKHHGKRRRNNDTVRISACQGTFSDDAGSVVTLRFFTGVAKAIAEMKRRQLQAETQGGCRKAVWDDHLKKSETRRRATKS